MTLALFDLDNTLLNGDSDHGWGEFLIAQKLVDETSYRKQNDQFYSDYLKGTLDIYAYQNFCLGRIAQFSPVQLDALLQQYMQQAIEAMILPKAEQLIASHRQQGHELMIVTATNEVITQPIAKRLGVAHLIATQAERDAQGHPTGFVSGIASYAGGKIERVKQWLEAFPEQSLEGSFFYSDSHNDIPLLDYVDHAFAVDPDAKLLAYAQKKQWPVISLRD